MIAPAEHAVSERLAAWLAEALDDPGPFRLRPLTGGNSNDTAMLVSPAGRWVLRRPPRDAVGAGGHAVDREHRVLAALHAAGAPVPRPLELCRDPTVAGRPALLMEHVEGLAVTRELPMGAPPGAAGVRAVGEAVVDALARVHLVDWEAAGLEGFGRPDGFLARQVARWHARLVEHGVRALPDGDRLARRLAARRPAGARPAVLHGDFHVDNCLLTGRGGVIRVAAIIDWETATIGDPLLDLGLLLALWGHDRPARPGFAHVQAFSRATGAPAREELAERYAAATGRDVADLRWYMALALLKLAAVVEGAWALHRAGRLDTPYARGLEHDVPRLLAEGVALAPS